MRKAELAILSCLAVILTFSPSGLAAERKVASSEELAQVLKGAQTGDCILLAPGDYVISAQLSVGPLTIESTGEKGKTILSPAEDGEFVFDTGNVEGTITVRGLVFDGGGKEVGALRTLGARLEVEDCEFRDFAGKATIRSGCEKDNRRKLRGIRVSRCVFRSNPKGGAVGSVGPALVEDCTFENIRRGVNFEDWSGRDPKLHQRYKVIIRRNCFYRTEGTVYPCHVMTTRTTEPQIYENLIHDMTPHNSNALEIAGNRLDRSKIPTAAKVYRNVIINKWKAADSGWIHEGIEYGENRPTHGKIHENLIVGVGKGGVRPSLYNKGDNNEWFNNTLYFEPKIPGQFFHCYGVKCRYYNNIQVRGRASMLNQKTVDEWISKKWLGPTCTSEDHAMEHSCFWKVTSDRRKLFVRGKGYFEADPKFVDPENMDFHLRYDSPCINRGTGSRDGLTPTDIGAFEYPIQVCSFSVDRNGVCTWKWANGFQEVSKRVRIRWNKNRFPTIHDGKGDVTVTEVQAEETRADTGKRSGYFAAFVLDAKDRWSAPTPDGVHAAVIGSGEKPKPTTSFFPKTPVPGGK